MFDLYDMTHANEVMRKMTGGACNTLNSRMGTGGNQVPVVHTYTIMGNIIGRQSKNGGHQMGIGKDVATTLNTIDRHAVAGTLCADDCKGAGNQYVSDNKLRYEEGIARRLTPLECERLQGYPDGWTAVEFKGKPATDTRRYRAIGNGMAQPCADFVISQIVKNISRNT